MRYDDKTGYIAGIGSAGLEGGQRPKRDRATGLYSYRGWNIKPAGGFCTMRRFLAYKGTMFLWAFRLRDVIAKCDAAERGEITESDRPLYM